MRGNADFYISHSTLADIETGAVSSIHKLFSRAACLKVSLEELLAVFGIDSNEVRHFAPDPLNLLWPRPESVAVPQPDFQLTDFRSQETALLKLNPHELAVLPLPCESRSTQGDTATQWSV